MMQVFAKEVENDFKVDPFLNASLFKQGTELVALQRDNLEMGNIAPQDISKQIPAWSILTSAYLFRDANHLSDVLVERPRRPVQEAGRGAGEDQDPRADLLRHAAGGAEAEQEDQYAGRPGRRQAAHAAGRRLAAPRPLARREPDADGLRRGLHRPADRRDRRPGQPAAERAEHEVLRGDVADRADLAPRRLRPAGGEPEDLERHVAGAAEGLPGRRRQGDRVERRRAPEARGRSSPTASASRACRSTSPTRTPSARTRRRCTSPPTRRRNGRRGCWRRSTR